MLKYKIRFIVFGQCFVCTNFLAPRVMNHRRQFFLLQPECHFAFVNKSASRVCDSRKEMIVTISYLLYQLKHCIGDGEHRTVICSETLYQLKHLISIERNGRHDKLFNDVVSIETLHWRRIT
jgi:hypothetical protein